MNEQDPPPKRRWRRPEGDGAKAEGGGARALHKPVKARRGLTVSSRAWIERQLNDPYVQKAKAAGYRARAAFKLIEIDDRFHILHPGALVADLGAAPGGWAQIAVERGARKVVGVDLLPIAPLAGCEFLEMDFLAPGADARLIAALGGPPDVVLSDMAANTTGHTRTDQIRTGALVEAATDFALSVLAPGGAFVAKAFQGGVEAGLLKLLKPRFDSVRHVKPPSSRAESKEVYLVALGFKPET